MATKITTAQTHGARAGDSAAENAPSASDARSAGAGGSGGGKRGGGKSGKAGKAGKNRGPTPAQGQNQHRDKEKSKAKTPLGDQGQQKSDEATTSSSSPTEANTGASAGTEGGDTVEAVCWICAEPVKYYSVSTCNHRTCHVCALRLRALYKKLDCAFCKVCMFNFIFIESN